ncbi:cytochrome P450 76C2-like [Solanum pennellii]|uniref:Cytochrome P450 76C2-like n=1 Tax=Solanum pennellii TaxID=28526 RepID=A0ABM1VHB9_SOLPN|nr:cytochrome P450 76C2-like [Solanum pennellii]
MSLKFSKPLFDSFSCPWQESNIEQKGAFLSYVLGIIGLLWFLWLFTNKSKKGQPPLPPGPKALPLLGNLHSVEPQLHTYFASLSQTYGPICRLWLGKKLGIIITSPALAREVLKEQDTIFANIDEPAAGREMSYGGLESFWSEMAQAGLPVNVGEQMFLTMFNVITSMLWGGTVKGEERANLGSEFRHVVYGITELLGIPNVSDLLGLVRFAGCYKEDESVGKEI